MTIQQTTKKQTKLEEDYKTIEELLHDYFD